MADIIVGGRRLHPQRNLRGIAIAVVLVAVCVLVAYFIYERVVSYIEPEVAVPDEPIMMRDDAAADAPPLLTFGTSSLAYSGTLAILRTTGRPNALGAAHGRLLGSEVTAVSKAMRANIAYTISRGGFFAGLTYDMRLRWRYRFLDDGVPGHQLVEAASILRGVRHTSGAAPEFESFIRQQALLDVGVAAPWTSNASFRTMARSLSFTTTLRGASGDRLFVARSLALPGAADGGDEVAKRIVVSFVKADSVIPFASVGWPGMIGVVSGINAEGIAVMVHPVRTHDVAISRQAQPIPLLARDVLENARSLEDALGILQHANPLGAAAFLVVDGNARKWAVVERSPSKFAVVQNPNLAVVTDLLGTEAFAEDPENDRAERIQPAAMRQRRVKRLLRRRLTEPEEVIAILRDRRDPAGAQLPPGHRGAVYDVSAVHAALFDTSGMVLWVADGGAAGNRFRAFDLRYELRHEGARPAPPADLPADPELDPSVAHRVRSARRALRTARRAWRSGKLTRARELIQRALAFAPDLPEALKLAGDLARAGKDKEAAERYYERFLDKGPDDLAAEAEVRAILRR